MFHVFLGQLKFRATTVVFSFCVHRKFFLLPPPHDNKLHVVPVIYFPVFVSYHFPFVCFCFFSSLEQLIAIAMEEKLSVLYMYVFSGGWIQSVLYMLPTFDKLCNLEHGGVKGGRKLRSKC